MVYIDNLFTKVKRTHGTYNENGDYYKFWFYVFSLWFLIKKDPQETVSLTTYSGLYSMFGSHGVT